MLTLEAMRLGDNHADQSEATCLIVRSDGSVNAAGLEASLDAVPTDSDSSHLTLLESRSADHAYELADGAEPHGVKIDHRIRYAG